MPASPTSSKAEYVFPVGKCTNTFIKHINVCTWPATQINTDSTNGLVLLPSPADWNDSPSMANIYIYTQYGCLRPPVAGLRHSVYPVAALGSLDPQFSQLLVPRHRKALQGCSPTPFANERSSLNDLLINAFIYAITTSLTGDQHFQLSNRSQLTA